MGKYDPLRDYLASKPGDEVRMTFSEVEELIGGLPESARIHRAWWANDSKVEALAWRAAGWRVESVNQNAEHVVFTRAATGGPLPAPHAAAAGAVQTSYVDVQVTSNIKARTGVDQFDYMKLLRLIEELNDNYRRANAYAAHALLRAILDHVPPLLGCVDFKAVANNYPWGRTDKNYMRRLLDFKLQADDTLHRQISQKRDLINLDDMPPRTWINRLLQECIG